ncbi:unnamed protein product [Peniophora sp. CBMAI 1063]|nr:unnamed protein product [Peniophora sp. CBMAI 1063]
MSTAPLLSAYWSNAANARLPLLPQSDASLTEEAFELAYDAEVAAVYAALDVLQAYRDVQRAGITEQHNARLDTTTVFPPEILSHVLSYLPQPYTDSSQYVPREHLSWMSAAHVCRRWRAIALSNQSLWSRLHLMMPDDVWSTFMERAGGASLVIQGRWRFASPLRRQDIYERLERVEELDLRVPEIEELADLFLAGTAACLRSFIVHTSPTPRIDPSLSHFLLSCAPALRHLNLYGVHFPWGCTIPTVNSLRLYDPTLPGDPIPSFAQVVQTLTSTNLEELVLTGSQLFSLSSEVPPPVPIKLGSLTLKCHAQQAVILLRTFILSPTCSIDVYVRSDQRPVVTEVMDDDTSDTALIASTIRDHLSRADAPRYKALQLQCYSRCAELKLDHADPVVTPGSINGVRIEISVPGSRIDKSSCRAKILKLTRAVPVGLLKGLQHLTLSSGIHWSREDTYRLLHHTTNVERLTFYSEAHGGNAAGLLYNIISPSRPSSNVTNAESPTHLLPALKELYLHKVNFNNSVRCNDKDVPLTEALLDVLKSRRDVGCRVQVLRLGECRSVLDNDLYRFSRWVADVMVV